MHACYLGDTPKVRGRRIARLISFPVADGTTLDSHLSGQLGLRQTGTSSGHPDPGLRYHDSPCIPCVQGAMLAVFTSIAKFTQSRPVPVTCSQQVHARQASWLQLLTDLHRTSREEQRF